MGDDEQLLDKHGLAERWGVDSDTINRMRRRDPPPPAEQTRPKLLFDPDEADRWAREHGPDDLDVQQPDRLVDKAGLAERLGVSENTVRYYRYKRGMPAAGRGDHNRLLFDPEEVEQWLERQDIRDREADADGDAGEPDDGREDAEEETAPAPDTGMEEMVRRERELERDLYEQVRQDPCPANLKAYKKVAQERRLAEKELRKEKEAMGHLVPRADFENTVLDMAAWFRRELQSMPETRTPQIVDALSQAGYVDDPRDVSEIVRKALSGIVDEALQELSDRVRDADVDG